MNKLLTIYDFTLSADNIEDENIVIDELIKIAKKFVFQLEMSILGYKHYQGRISLKVRKRLSSLLAYTKKKLTLKFHWSITSNSAHDDTFYVTKEDTRIAGPWSDKDIPIYIPRQYRNKINNLRPFQRVIFDSCNHFDDRDINFIYSPIGNKGKSVISSLCELYGRGVDMPICNDAEKLIQSLANYCIKKQIRNPSPILIDLPRAMDKSKLYGIYTAIEQIKKGKLYDTRYRYEVYWIDSPAIWIFSNLRPIRNMLSTDRWKIWEISKEYELVAYEEDTDSDDECDELDQ